MDKLTRGQFIFVNVVVTFVVALATVASVITLLGGPGGNEVVSNALVTTNRATTTKKDASTTAKTPVKALSDQQVQDIAENALGSLVTINTVTSDGTKTKQALGILVEKSNSYGVLASSLPNTLSASDLEIDANGHELYANDVKNDNINGITYLDLDVPYAIAPELTPLSISTSPIHTGDTIVALSGPDGYNIKSGKVTNVFTTAQMKQIETDIEWKNDGLGAFLLDSDGNVIGIRTSETRSSVVQDLGTE